MPEATVTDAYIDDFNIELGPHGAVVTCRTMMGLKEPMTQARLRMSIEHLKLLTFRMHALVRQVERDQQVEYPMSAKTLSAIRIPEEEWIAFWRA